MGPICATGFACTTPGLLDACAPTAWSAVDLPLLQKGQVNWVASLARAFFGGGLVLLRFLQPRPGSQPPEQAGCTLAQWQGAGRRSSQPEPGGSN